ncbi:MAG: DNA polymerase III subunit beta [Geovibrio sp.]|nr:DNA polymerase III subunit beta [Geovibrio sp.]
MKFSIDRAALLRALNHVQSVVERRNTIPILSNVLLKVEDGTLTLTATDMDLEINESVAAQIDKPGATTAPAHTLHDIVRKLPDDGMVDIELNAEGTQMTVQAGRSRFKLSCLPVADFPAISAGELPGTFGIPAADLRALIDRTKFAMSTEETRYYLNGIYLHAADNGGVPVLRAVATDGHRLAALKCLFRPVPKVCPGSSSPVKQSASCASWRMKQQIRSRSSSRKTRCALLSTTSS